MTEKLYLNHPLLKNFTASLLSCEENPHFPGQYVVLLDQTAFYPEGGGQPWDTGHIGNSQVTYVYEEQGRVFHVVAHPPSQSKDLSCTIDWSRRRDHMQQHLGQHLLSAVFYKNLEASTQGFHLGEALVTIDLDLPDLSQETADAIEDQVNDFIAENLSVKCHYPSQRELDQFPLRSAPTVTEGIRIVEIEGLDYSPCGGTHFPALGSVGLVKLIGWEKAKNGIRISFLCGDRAVKDYRRKHQTVSHLARDLSIKDLELEHTVVQLIASHRELHKTTQQQKRSLLEYQAQALYDQAEIHQKYRLITKVFHQGEMKELQSLANLLNQKEGTLALLALSQERAQVVFTRSKEVPANMNQLMKEVLPLIDGKGGGSPQTAQGGGPLVSNLEGLLSASINKLKREYLS